MKYYLIYKQSLIDNESFFFFLCKRGYWSLSINDALFFNTKKEADSVIENIIENNKYQ